MYRVGSKPRSEDCTPTLIHSCTANLQEQFEDTPLRVADKVSHAWGVRMGTRRYYPLDAHIQSPHVPWVKGSIRCTFGSSTHCRCQAKGRYAEALLRRAVVNAIRAQEQ